MIRAVLYSLIGIFVITFVRMVVGIIMRGFGDLLKEEQQQASSKSGPSSPGARPQPPKVPLSGELKPCLQCGTYVVASSALKATVKGEPAFFCSPECKQKAGA